MNYKRIIGARPSILCLLLIIFSLHSVPLNAQNRLIIKVSNIATQGELSLRGLTADFPYPILTTITVIDSQQNYIPGLADTLRWLRTNDVAENGQLINEIWQPLLEYHRDNSAFPDDPDVYHQFASPLFTEIRSSDSAATSTMLVLDVSTSMDEEFEATKDGARAYLNLLRDVDQAGIVLFSGEIVKYVEMTADKQLLIDTIDDAVMSGGTAIYDGIMQAIEGAKNASGRRSIIAYTDGLDNSSNATPEAVIDSARFYGLPVHTIALGENTREDVLSHIAEETGGLFFKAATGEDMKAIYVSLLNTMQNYYVMAHGSPDPFYNETWRNVDLTANTPTLEGRGNGFYYVGDFPAENATDLALSLVALTDTMIVEGADSLNIVQPGEIYEYQLEILNLGPNAADSVSLFHVLPDSAAILQASPAPAAVIRNMLFWRLAGPALNQKVVVSVSVKLDSNASINSGIFPCEAKIFAEMDSIWQNNYATDTVYTRHLVPEPVRNYDLSIEQIVTADTSIEIPGEVIPAVFVGNDYSCSLKIKNLGPNSARDFIVWDNFPDSIKVSAFTALPVRQTSDSLFWQIDSLANGDSLFISFKATVADSLPFLPYPLENVSGLIASQDTAAQNDSSKTIVYAIAPPDSPPLVSQNYNLSMEQKVYTDQTISVSDTIYPAVLVGDICIYRLKVENHGPKPACNFQVWDAVADSVSPGAFNISPTSQIVDTLFWQIDSLAAGDSLVFIFEAGVADSIPFTQFPLINESGIAAENDTLLTDNYSTTTVYAIFPPVQDNTDISVQQYVQADSFIVVNDDTIKYAREGETYFYTLIVTNQSTVTAQNVRIVDVLPDSIQTGSFQPSPTVEAGDSIVWEIDSLAPDSTHLIHFTATLPETMPAGENLLINTVTVSATNEDPTNLANNVSVDTVLIAVRPYDDWQPQIKATPVLVDVGDEIDVSVQVPVPIKNWDIWVYQSNSKIDSGYANTFIESTQLTPEVWLDIEPQYLVNQKFTATNEEQLVFELRVIDSFDEFKSVRTTVTVMSGKDFQVDRNVFTPAEQEELEIRLRFQKAVTGTLDLYDITGTRITKLIESDFNAGWNTFLWDGLTEEGQQIGSGFYIITLRANGKHAWKKIMIVR